MISWDDRFKLWCKTCGKRPDTQCIIKFEGYKNGVLKHPHVLVQIAPMPKAIQ